VKAPEHELGVGVEGAVIEDRPVDAMALDGIRATIEGSKESRRQKSVLSVLAVRRVGQFGKFWPGGFLFWRGSYFLSSRPCCDWLISTLSHRFMLPPSAKALTKVTNI
jgi:hypothetical protein